MAETLYEAKLGSDTERAGEKQLISSADLERKQSAEHEKPYSLGYGHMGNGLTVWNRLEERDGDYVTVAHIDPDRHVTFYGREMPESVKEKILDIARTSDARISATQDAPVFRTPPLEPGHSPVFYGTAEEDRAAYHESHKQNVRCAQAIEKALGGHYRNNRIDIGGVLEDVRGYSAERISVVLANTMRLRKDDGRFSRQNRQWQNDIQLPESALTRYTAISSHSELVNYLVTTFRERGINKPRQLEIPETVPKTPESAIDPIREARIVMGRGSVVTSAQPGRTYTGEMIRLGERHAVQKIAPGMRIVHNLGDIENAEAILAREGRNREIRVSYDMNGGGSVKPVPGDRERKKGISR